MIYSAYHEQKPRGTFEFPIQLYYVDKNHPQYEMPFHWHMECELILILSGSFDITVNTAKYTLNKGESAFIPSEYIHGGTPHGAIYECIVFDMEKFLTPSPRCTEKYTYAFENGYIKESVFKDGTQIAKITDSLFESMEKESRAYEFTATGLLWQFMGAILEQNSYSSAPLPANANKNRRIKHVLTKIKNDYNKRLTLADLAAEAQLNPQYLCKIFKAATGKTPIDYLNFYRVECAAEMLVSSRQSITEIALSCGFNDLGYFNRLFKRQKKLTPTQYRRTIEKK